MLMHDKNDQIVIHPVGAADPYSGAALTPASPNCSEPFQAEVVRL